MPDSSVEVLSETVLDGLRLSDWIEQAGISRSAAYELLKLTGVEPEPRKVPGSRKPVSHLTPEQMEVLEPLARQLSDGATMPQLKKQFGKSGTIPDGSGSSETALSHDPEQSGMIPSDTVALVAAMAAELRKQPSTPPDPLSRARGLAEAADHQLVLTTDELVALGVKGIDGFADGDQGFGFCFRKHRQRNRTLWTVERSIGVKTLKQLDQAIDQRVESGRQVGFAAHLTDTKTGISALFAATTIS